MRHSLRQLCLFASLFAAVLAGPGVSRGALAASMNPPQDLRAKDFAFIKRDGVYHLFYIRHNDLLPPFATENDLGHAVSTDLYHWTQLAPVLAVNPNGWDNLHVWAPAIVESGGLYWMFYTGVTDGPGFADTQRIGVAVSSDLMTWNRTLSSPVWQTSAAPWAWWTLRNTLMSCRDPFVMRDPRAPSQFLLYYTATPASDTLSNIVGVARSPTGDLASWADEKPLWITYKTFSFNASTESPHLFQHNGLWFMFITTQSGQPLSYYTSSDPTGDPAQWIYRGRLRNMLGYDTSNWYASEYLKDGDEEFFAIIDDVRISLRKIVWTSPSTFALTDPPFFRYVRLEWTRSAIREFEPVGLRLTTANWRALDRPLVAYVQNADGSESPAPIDSLGFKATPVLTGDTTVVSWYPRRWPCSLPAAQPMRMRMAADDGTATTGWLSVFRNTAPAGTPVRPGGSAPDETPPPEPLPTGLEPDTIFTFQRSPVLPAPVFGLRTLTATPLGRGTALAFELAQPADARVDVFDLLGRRLVTLADRHFAAGAHVLPWDGRDDAGARLARGLYFARAVAGAYTATSRIFIE